MGGKSNFFFYQNVGRFKVGKAKVEDNNELKLETISKAQSKDSSKFFNLFSKKIFFINQNFTNLKVDNDDADAQIEELPVKKEHVSSH